MPCPLAISPKAGGKESCVMSDKFITKRSAVVNAIHEVSSYRVSKEVKELFQRTSDEILKEFHRVVSESDKYKKKNLTDLDIIKVFGNSKYSHFMKKINPDYCNQLAFTKSKPQRKRRSSAGARKAPAKKKKTATKKKKTTTTA